MKWVIALMVALSSLVLTADAEACHRCGRFGRLCRFSHGHVDAISVAPYVAASPQNIVVQNNYQAPNGAAAFLAPQGQSVYGLAQASQPYYLDPSAVLRQAAELTKGAQQLAQQGLTGYNQTASLALTLQASQPAIQAAALTAPQQLNAGRSISQTIRLTQNVSGQWTVEASGGENQGSGEGGAPTQPAAPPSLLSDPQPEAPGASPSGVDEIGGRPSIKPSPGAFVRANCASCHGLDKSAPKGNFYIDAGHKLTGSQVLLARQHVKSGKMPPGQNLPELTRSSILADIEALWDGKPCIPQ